VVHVTAHASVYTLVLMSLDRYLAVVHPITSMTIRNVRNTSIVLGVAWVVIVVANAPMLLEFQVCLFYYYLVYIFKFFVCPMHCIAAMQHWTEYKITYVSVVRYPLSGVQCPFSGQSVNNFKWP